MTVETSEVQIEVSQLELGMHVVRLDRPWFETDFILQGFIINDIEDLQSLKQQCDSVFIQAKVIDNRPKKPKKPANRKQNLSRDSKGTVVATSQQKQNPLIRKGPPKASKKLNYLNKISTEQELASANIAYGAARQTAKNIMNGIRLGRVLDMNEAREVVDDVVGSLLRNNDAMAWLTKIRNRDEYTAEHSLNVCVLSATFARHLGHKEAEIKTIALCGLLHDVGKSKIPEEILNKMGRFSEEESRIMKHHSTLGRNLLMSISSTDRACIDVAHSHHERIDGRGYPRNLKENQIPYYAKIVSLTDVYDAITSTRCYDHGRASMSALDIIYKARGTQFDEALAVEFIKCIGIYPPGSIIEFINDEVGIILSSNPESKLNPRVILILDSNKKARKQKIIDLKNKAKDHKGKEYVIAREVPNGSYGIDLAEFIRRGLKIEPRTQKTPQNA